MKTKSSLITITALLVLNFVPFVFAQEKPNTNGRIDESGGLNGILLLVFVMAGAGCLGGFASYLLGPPRPDDLDVGERKWHLQRSLIAGVVASFCVPLFLALAGAASGAQSDLIDQLLGQPPNYKSWFILMGFCLVAGVSAPKFISALSNRLLQDVLRDAKENENKINELEEDLTDLQGSVVPATTTIADDAVRVLQVATAHEERRPTVEQIQASVEFAPEQTQRLLQDLEEKGFVRSKDYGGKTGWRVRTAGKTLLAQHALNNSGDAS